MIPLSPLSVWRQPQRERLGKVFVGMTLRVPRVEVQHEVLGVRLGRVVLRIGQLVIAEQLAPLALATQLKRVVDGVAGFVPQNAHARVVIAALHFEHLRELQFGQTRMREIERDGDAGNAVGREPLVREPEVRAEQQAAAGQLAVQLLDSQREVGAFDLQIELAELHVEQFLVAKGCQVLGPQSPKRARHAITIIDYAASRFGSSATATAPRAASPISTANPLA